MSRRSALSGSNQTRERPNQGEMNTNIGEVHFDTPRTVHCSGRKVCVTITLHQAAGKHVYPAICAQAWMTDSDLKKRFHKRAITKRNERLFVGKWSAIEFYKLVTIVHWLCKCAQRTFIESNAIIL